MPAILADALGPTEGLRAIPIVEPDLRHAIGLVAPRRDPATPMVTALVSVARTVARTLDADDPVPAAPQDPATN
jgi:hypothetical protein